MMRYKPDLKAMQTLVIDSWDTSGCGLGNDRVYVYRILKILIDYDLIKITKLYLKYGITYTRDLNAWLFDIVLSKVSKFCLENANYVWFLVTDILLEIIQGVHRDIQINLEHIPYDICLNFIVRTIRDTVTCIDYSNCYLLAD
jgi:hypothetical protein